MPKDSFGPRPVWDGCPKISTCETGDQGREGGATEADVEDVRVTLDHQHLPALEAVGLIRQTDDDEIVSVPSSPIWADQTLKSYIETNAIPATDVSKALLALSNERRREALDVLQRNEQVTIEELATRFEHSESELDNSVPDVESSGVLIELLHVHIPKLAGFGIVETDGQQVRYTGDPLLDEWWFDASSTTGSEGGENEAGDVSVLRGVRTSAS